MHGVLFYVRDLRIPRLLYSQELGGSKPILHEYCGDECVGEEETMYERAYHSKDLMNVGKMLLVLFGGGWIQFLTLSKCSPLAHTLGDLLCKAWNQKPVMKLSRPRLRAAPGPQHVSKELPLSSCLSSSLKGQFLVSYWSFSCPRT